MYNLLINPYMEKFHPLMEYMRTEGEPKPEGKKGMTSKEIRAILEEVTERCLELDCKVRWVLGKDFVLRSHGLTGQNAQKAP